MAVFSQLAGDKGSEIKQHLFYCSIIFKQYIYIKIELDHKFLIHAITLSHDHNNLEKCQSNYPVHIVVNKLYLH